MKFSVLISIYHKDNSVYLNSALKSILNNQTVLPSEIVIVKDGPLTHELEEVLNNFTFNIPVKYVSLAYNQGLGTALNEGLKYCSYSIVARMDADDIAKPNRFETQLTIFRQFPDLDVVGAAVDEFDNDISIILTTRKLPEIGKDIYKFAKKRNPINHPVVMFKKESVLAAGGYKHFPLFEDYYLWIRMLANGCKFYNCPDSLLYFRFSQNTYNRRAGLQYALTELKLQREFYNLGILNWWDFLFNVPLKFIIRISPKYFRVIIYKHILR